MENQNQTRRITSQYTDWSLSFDCPASWKLTERPIQRGVSFSLHAPPDSDLSLHASITVWAWLDRGYPPSHWADEWIERYQAAYTFCLLARTETKVADAEAIQVDAAHDMPKQSHKPNEKRVTIRERIIFAVRGAETYRLTYWVPQKDFEEHLPVFEDLVASFQM